MNPVVADSRTWTRCGHDSVTFVLGDMVRKDPEPERDPAARDVDPCSIVLPNLMPEGEFGNLQVFMSFVMAFEIALHYGLPAAVSKFIAEDTDFLGYFLTKGFKLQVIFSLVLFVISLIISPFATMFFKADTTFWLLFVLAMVGFSAAIVFGFQVEGSAAGAGTLAAAWLATKVTQPARIAATVVLTPLAARVARRLRRSPAAGVPTEQERR